VLGKATPERFWLEIILALQELASELETIAKAGNAVKRRRIDIWQVIRSSSTGWMPAREKFLCFRAIIVIPSGSG
jgi:hypothetical protein